MEASCKIGRPFGVSKPRSPRRANINIGAVDMETLAKEGFGYMIDDVDVQINVEGSICYNNHEREDV